MITRAALYKTSEEIQVAIKNGDMDRVIELSAKVAGEAAAFAALKARGAVTTYNKLAVGQFFIWDDLCGLPRIYERVKGGAKHPTTLEVLRGCFEPNDAVIVVPAS